MLDNLLLNNDKTCGNLSSFLFYSQGKKSKERVIKIKRLNEITEEQYLLCNSTNRELLEDFLANSTEKSDKTLLVYRSNLRIWLVWVMNNLNNKVVTDIKPREYLRFQNWLLELGHSSSDISNKRSAISSFNDYIVVYYNDEYPTFHNFINKSIKKPEASFVREKEPPTREEIERLIDVLEHSDRKDKRQLIAYLSFVFDTGCRRAETMQIMKDIIHTPITTKTVKVKDEDGNIVEKEAKYYLTPKIRCKGKGKTGKLRQLKFSETAMNALKAWVMEREDDCPYMFVSRPFGDSVAQASESTLNNWCSKIFTPIVGRRIHPHCFRESAATDIVVAQGKSIEAARALLGHESSETTKIYVCGVDAEEDADELFV